MRTDMTKLVVAFHNFTNAPNTKGNRPLLWRSRAVMCDSLRRESNCTTSWGGTFPSAVTKVSEDFPTSITGSFYSKHECGRGFPETPSVLLECNVSLPRNAQHKFSPPLNPRIFILVNVINIVGHMQ
jgi:hypothetical protein